MNKLEFLSSAGIRIIFKAKKLMDARKGKFMLVNLQPQVRKVFEIIKVLDIMDVFSNQADASRIGEIERFQRPGSLANYWGLTPGCRNSGDAKDRLGSITKAGSPIVRHFLGQAVVHLLRRDVEMKGWFQKIKKRRGAKIARVAVMRRLATIIWHMVKKQQPYRPGRMLRPTDDQAA